MALCVARPLSQRSHAAPHVPVSLTAVVNEKFTARVLLKAKPVRW